MRWQPGRWFSRSEYFDVLIRCRESDRVGGAFGASFLRFLSSIGVQEGVMKR